MIAALLDDPSDHVLFTDVALADVLDHQPRLGNQSCGAVSHTISQQFSELGVVEDADTLGIKVPGHPVRIADPG